MPTCSIAGGSRWKAARGPSAATRACYSISPPEPRARLPAHEAWRRVGGRARMSLSQEGSCTSGGPEGRWTIEVGASVGAIGRDGAPPGEVRAVERDRGDGDALAVWQAGQHLAGRARDAAPAEAPELPLASDAIGHRHEGDVLQGARGREALRRPAVPAPHGALVVIGDPVGAVDDEVGAEVDQAANEVGKDQVVADRHTDAPERGVDHERRIASGIPLALGGEEMDLAVEAEQTADGREEGLGVVEATALGDVEPDCQVQAMASGGRREPRDHGAVRRLGERRETVGDEVARSRAFRKHRELGSRPCGRLGEVVDLLQIGSHLARDAVHLHDGDAKIHYAAPGSDPIAARRTSCSFASPPVNSRTAAPSRMTRTRWLSASTSFSSEEMRTMATP